MPFKPHVIIDLRKIRKNARTLFGLCHGLGITVAAVTKVFCADRRVVEVFIEEGADFLADSRLMNISRYPEASVPKMLLRLPAPDEAEEAVMRTDFSLNSEIAAIKKLAEAAKAQRKRHGVILMVDVGDLREGLHWKNTEQILAAASCASREPWLFLAGIGLNLTCYGSIIPTEENLGRLAGIADNIKERLGADLPIVSGGNSSSLDLLLRGRLPSQVTNLRLGESIARGVETAYCKPFCNLEQDCLMFEATLIELQEKPSFPDGIIGVNAFGEKPSFIDKGVRLRGILSAGRQDINPSGLSCATSGAEILGASSDHLLVDLTQAQETFKVGDALRFRMDYSAILSAFTSEYVGRRYV